MRSFIYTALVLFSLTGLIACSTNSTDKVEQTYPGTFSLEKKTLAQLLSSTKSPDSLNTDVYVTDLVLASGCPYNANCLGDGILIADSLNTSSPHQPFYIQVNKPRQFQKGKQYTLSLEITHIDTNGYHHVNLLGYSPLLRYD